MKALLKTVPIILVKAMLTGVGNADFDRAEDAIRYRQAVMILIGRHFGRMGDVVKSKVPYDQAAFAGDAAVVKILSRLPWEAFLFPGSDKGKTQLKSEALNRPDELKAAAQVFESDAAKLSEIAAAGDLDAVKPQFGTVAQSCKHCHAEFRSR